MYTPVISASALAAIYPAEKVIIIDATAGPGAQAGYEEKHLPGALYMDLNTALADIKEDAANGGRHPLPSAGDFAETLGRIGISNDSHIIIYDDKNGSNAAARLWWMLKSAGHEKVQVLDGGIQAAEKAGIPLTGKPTTPLPKTNYITSDFKWPQVSIDEVQQRALDKNFIVIDVRDAYRYLGESEPIDLVAGHIPGAVNVPFSTNLDENGLFADPRLLNEKYTHITAGIPSQNIIVHCGSGVTACHTILAMAHAGLDVPALYVGSWSEWSRNNKSIATGTE